MADVFVSYASEDREHAAGLAHALQARGWTVWWDRRIVPGQSFDLTIERELEDARSVVVLWTPNSVGAEWVKNEAAVAAERGKLVPAMMGDARLPLEFRRRQAADLNGWNGRPDHPGFAALCDGVAALLGAPLAGTPTLPAPPSAPVHPPAWLWLVAAGAIVLVLLIHRLWPTAEEMEPAPAPPTPALPQATPAPPPPARAAD